MTVPAGPLPAPVPEPVELPAGRTAVLALDLGRGCDAGSDPGHPILPAVRTLLDAARSSSVPVLHTLSRGLLGTERGAVSEVLGATDREEVLFPDAFDKFHGGGLQQRLVAAGARELVLTGSWISLCVLYTATTALREHRYDVVIPLDAVASPTPYEFEYSVHQLTRVGTLAPGLTGRLRWTRTDLLRFAP